MCITICYYVFFLQIELKNNSTTYSLVCSFLSLVYYNKKNPKTYNFTPVIPLIIISIIPNTPQIIYIIRFYQD